VTIHKKTHHIQIKKKTVIPGSMKSCWNTK